MQSLNEINTLYEQNVDKIYRFFYYRVYSHETAEDLTSETFLQFVREIKQHKEISYPVRFLYGIARNVFLKFLRNKYHSVIELPFEMFESVLETYGPENSDEKISEQTLEDIAKIYIEKLPDSQKRVVRMRIIEKMSVAEIARSLGKTDDYVKTNQKRGVQSLRKMLACTPLGTKKGENRHE